MSLSAIALGAAAPAVAQEREGPWFFGQAGAGRDSVKAGGIGLVWPFAWRKMALGGEFTTHGELSASYWHAQAIGGGHEGFVQLAAVPLLRWRPGAGRSPWFVEGGIGLTVSDQRYVTAHKAFRTRLNFSDNLAVGRTFGANGDQELSLRLQHTSNAGIKKPNPGEDLVLVRYAVRF